jgi:hypothetical protein
VYFSSLGPCSYGLGSAEHGQTKTLKHYEDTLIKDCFGVERLAEYQGQGKLSAVLVYALPATALSAAPGGRDNSLVVAKAAFTDLSLPDPTKNFFLSPAFIVGAFHVDVSTPIRFGATSAVAAKDEAAADRRSQLKIRAALHSHEKNVEEAGMASLAAGFAYGHGVGGYGEDLETEALTITVSTNKKEEGGEDSTKPRASPTKAPNKAKQQSVSRRASASTTIALAPVLSPGDLHGGLGSQL